MAGEEAGTGVRPRRERKSLGLECKKTQCDQNLHCFLPPPKMPNMRQAMSSPVPPGSPGRPADQQPAGQTEQPEGRCWNCGVDLVDWNRVHRQSLDDVGYTFHCLKHEVVRHKFWHKELDPWAVNNAKRRGRRAMPEYAEKRIRQAVGPAQPFNDGHQTPGEGDVLFYAQHATATCCRPCIEAWHGIPQGRELTDEEVAYCAKLLTLYVDDRMPDLKAEKQKVPNIRQKSSDSGETQGGQKR